jgi:hypothetical protein
MNSNADETDPTPSPRRRRRRSSKDATPGSEPKSEKKPQPKKKAQPGPAVVGAAGMLQVRFYGEKPGDFQEISRWWSSGVGSGMFQETILPPLGVVVESYGTRIAALWCYECLGIGVAFLAFACTRPGLSASQALPALFMGETTIASVLKARGRPSLLVAHVRPGVAQQMRRIGYAPAADNLMLLVKRIG